MQRDLKVEVGFGNGEFLSAMAESEQETDFVGIELYRPGIKKLERRIERAGTKNIRVIFGDAFEAIPALPGKATEFFFNFPDPWPKRRHKKRRLIRPRMVELLHEKLMPKGKATLVTDFAPYAGEMLVCFEAHGSFLNLAGRMKFLNQIEGRLPTKYERKYMAQGVRIYYLQFEAL